MDIRGGRVEYRWGFIFLVIVAFVLIVTARKQRHILLRPMKVAFCVEFEKTAYRGMVTKFKSSKRCTLKFFFISPVAKNKDT